ncbi:MAG TPA: PAS domain S-box protein [Thermoanaerobaculia bacterium]
MATIDRAPVSRGAASSAHAVTRFAAAGVVVIAAAVIAGWLLQMPVLTSVLQGSIGMKFNTALCFILCAAAILLIVEQKATWSVRAGICFATVVLAFAVATAIELLAAVDLRIDQLFFVEPAHLNRLTAPGRMSFLAATAFIFASAAILGIRKRVRGYWPSGIIATSIAAVSFFVLMGYANGASYFHDTPTRTVIAANTAAAFLLLSIALLGSEPDTGWFSLLFTAHSPVAKSMRRVVPAAIIATIAIGWMRLLAERARLLDPEILVSIMITTQVAVIIALVVWSGNLLQREYLERQADQKALAESGARYRMLMEHASDGILINDVDGRFLDVNQSACALLGYTKAELLTMKLADFIPVDDLATNPPRFNTLAQGEQVMFTRRVLRKSAPPLHVELSVKPLPDGTVQTLMRDITGRQIAEELLRNSEERFRALIENSSDIIAVVDAAGRVLYESPSAERILGFTSEELVGTSAFDRMHPDDRQRVRALFVAGLAESRAIGRIEYRTLHKDGSWRSCEAIGLNMLQDPAVRGIIVTARDVTERKLIESELERERRVSGLGHLAATIAHEFNNVMMGIQPFAEIIARTAATNKDLVTASQHIQTSIKRGRRVTQEILRFTRPVEPILNEIDVAAWLQDLRPELMSLLGDQLRLVISVAPNIRIRGDAGQLTQVLANLTLNARDAMASPNGTLTIRVSETAPGSRFAFGVVPNPEQYVHIAVSDTGSGIPAEALPHIFDPLFTTKRSGTGLGLPVARQIVEKHVGHVFVESTAAAGTAFHIFLPRAQNRFGQLGAGVDAIAAAAAPNRPTRILLVEDDELVAAGTVAVLSASGFDVKVVGTGAECMPAIDAFDPDAIVLDVGLPDVDGIDLYGDIAAKYESLPVVFSTGHGDSSRIGDLLRKPTLAFLQKPYDCSVLIEMLEKVTAIPTHEPVR